jgi:hypothetical protein
MRCTGRMAFGRTCRDHDRSHARMRFGNSRKSSPRVVDRVKGELSRESSNADYGTSAPDTSESLSLISI